MLPPDAAGAAPRRTTGDPDRFLIPRERVPEALLERIRAGGEAAPPLPAATVVVRRGSEVLLLRRPQRSGFAAGAWVFPGGRVDAGDADPALRSALHGSPAGIWARRLELDDLDAAAAFVVAALRETFEETGILLATGGSPAADEMRAMREALLAEEAGFAEVTSHLGTQLDAGALAYIAHWVTPIPERRRYDTRFFLASVPAGAEADLHAGEELVEARWLTPGDAVAGFAAGDLPMLPPTVHTLRGLATGDLPGPPDAPVPRILPEMRETEAGVEIVIRGPGSGVRGP
jgi:8-oxo-dGTP pyrophosphatase MutT (NUDIX family)